VTTCIWEWVVDRGAGRDTSGVSMTRHGAMDALARSLTAAGAPAGGRVVPLSLVDDAWGPFYLRMAPRHTADYDMGVIRWR
jgi:hypothetical protein